MSVYLGLLFCALWPTLAFAHPLKDAYRAFDKQEYETAETHFREHIAKHPDDWEQIYNAGVASFQKGQFDEAQKLFDQARQSPDPQLRSRAAYNSAICDVMRGRYEAAEQSLKEALSYDNGNQKAEENLAWVRQQKKSSPPPPSQGSTGRDPHASENSGETEQDPSTSSSERPSPSGEEPSSAEQAQEPSRTPESGSEKAPGSSGKPTQPAQDPEQPPAGVPQSEAQASRDPTQADPKGAGASSQPQQQDPTRPGASGAGTPPAQPSERGSIAPSAPGSSQEPESPDLKSSAEDRPGGAAREGQAPGDAEGQGTAQSNRALGPNDKVRLFEMQDAEAKLRRIEDQIGRYPIEIDTREDRGAGRGKEW